jgi:hypothetical protein
MECQLCKCALDARRHKFLVPPNQGLNHRSTPKHFCSDECLLRWQAGWISSECHNCGDSLPGKVCRNLRSWNDNPVFCSIDCDAVFRLRQLRTHLSCWKDMRSNRSRINKEVRWRDGNACKVCGKEQSESELHVDHIVPFLLCQINDRENLLTLCHSCHSLKTGIENELLLGRIAFFLNSLRKVGWPMTKVKAAMKLYGLPIRVPYRPMPSMWGTTRWVMAKGKRCHPKVLERFLAGS